MTYFFTETLLKLFRFEVFCNLSTKLAEIIYEFCECFNYVSFEVSKVDKHPKFF